MPTVIFDMDGVLSDSQEPVAKMESDQLARHGIHLTPAAITKRFAGVADSVFYETVFREAGKQADVGPLIQEKWDIFLAQMRGQVREIPGAAATVRRLKAAGFKLGVASSSIPKFIALVMEELRIRDAFDTLTSGMEVAHGKPAPDIFLLAAERLKATPEQCVVIEDAVNGMVAAKASDMVCIALIQPHLKGLHDEIPADVVVDSHEQITPELIRRLVPRGDELR